MAGEYSVSLKKLIKDNGLEIISTPREPEQILITSKDVNRPGLCLAGYDDFFDPSRLQFIGLSEIGYLNNQPKDVRYERLKHFFSLRPSCVILSRGIEPLEELVPLALQYKVPVIRSMDSTSACMATLISYLGVELADRECVHGVLVEVYGEGILIMGDSGVGKSETAMELINRGHRLIADDRVEIRKVSSKSLVGTSPENIRHFIELRGVGIVNARQLFGMGAINMTQKIAMVVMLEPWDENKYYSVIGSSREYKEFMGIKVPMTTVPVKPGRNLSIIIEVAAMNNRAKNMGFDAEQELYKVLGMNDDDDPRGNSLEVWH